MVICFVAVIILAFFTGIAVGYIFFEFYAMNNSLIQFNYMEGDEEVGNFLEDIRRSKDNGARMLKFGTGNINNSTSANIQNTRKPMSMSALLRQNMQECEETAEEINSDNPFSESLPETLLPTTHTGITEVSEQNIQLEEVHDENFEYTEENTPNELEQEPFDEDFFKKYLSDENEVETAEDSNIENDDIENTTLENTHESLAEDEENFISDDLMSDIFDSMTSSNDDVSSCYQDEEITEEANDMLLTSPIPEDEDSEIQTVGESLPNNAEFNDDFMSMLENISISNEDDQSVEVTNENSPSEDDVVKPNSESTEPPIQKNDKIESSVCISLSGTSSSEGLLNIPLVMTEKPVEPTEPPKRKRGRPRKKK